MKISLYRVPVGLVAAAMIATTATAWHAASHAQASPPPTQSSTERGVTVKVTPKSLAAGATVWSFAVVLDTHSASLDDDLAATSVLVADGREIAPLRWEGAAPGGHHREGVLQFPGQPQPAAALELRIQRSNEAAARVFRWDGAALR